MINTPPPETANDKLSTGPSANWVFYVIAFGTFILIAVVVVWRIPMIKDALEWKNEGGVPGAPTSNGFDLSGSLVPAELINPAGVLRDHVKSLYEPPILTHADVRKRSEGRKKFLVPSDLVIGVEIAGQARAYPIRILNWHEIVNDVLGDTPIAVTYSPLTASVVVFDRRLDGSVAEFGHSGLLYNRNLLMFDRRDEQDDGLWCQLQGRAITGGSAGQRLIRYSAQLLTWGEWASLKPDTTCIDGRAAYFQKKKYDEDPYGAYHLAGRLDQRYAVSPLPPEGTPPPMTRMLVIEHAGETVEIFYSDVAANADSTGTWSKTIGGRRFEFHHGERPERLWFTTGGELPDLETIHTFWYGWYAMTSE